MDIETAKALAGNRGNSSRKTRAPKYLRDATRNGRTVSAILRLAHEEFQQARQQWRGAGPEKSTTPEARAERITAPYPAAKSMQEPQVQLSSFSYPGL